MASASKEHSGMTAAAATLPVQLSSSSATAPPVSAAQQADDEARKKNTDCVYFLASPLTCKKGGECDYRHSEYARVNPRDCWFWMNGSCLNPKCSFRHPPLDGLIGSQTAGSTGSSVMGSSSSSSGPSQAIPSAPFATAKQAAPCIFFQKGYCLKGDFCPFSHMMPYPTNSKPPQFPSSLGATDSLGFKKPFVGVEKCSQPKTHPRANVPKPVDALTVPRSSVKSTPPMVRNGASVENYGRKPPIGAHEELPKHKLTTSHPSINGSLRSKSGHTTNHYASSLEEQNLQNGKEIDDSLRESSPGFDVLVDDERDGPDYYGDEDRFPRIRDREGRGVNEFEVGYSDDYRSAGLEMYNDPRNYDQHEERYAHYRSSSERPLVEAAHFDRRAGMYKGETPDDRVENLDLRHRLSKHKRTSGLRSVVSHEYAPENHSEERRHKSSRRDRSPQPPTHRESSLGSRLQGRIKFPGKSSTGSGPKEEYDRARNRGRLSPTRLNLLTSHRGRVQDRLSGRVQQDDDVKTAPLRTRKDVVEDKDTNFTPPKSLAELKSSKQVQSKERLGGSVESTSLGKRKALESSVNTDGGKAFEGPKPLSEILKKKRGGLLSTIGKVSGTGERSTSSSLSALHAHRADSSPATDSVNLKQIDMEESKSIVEEDGSENHNSGKAHNSAGSESSQLDYKVEERLVNSGGEDDGYEEGYVQGEEEGGVVEGDVDGEYEYEQEEGENGELAEEYMDEDDGDDFAKKIGVMFA